MFREGFLMAWQSLLANKLRTILTMLGIIIGVAAVITLVSVGMGVRAQVEKNISDLGSNLIIVQPGGTKVPGQRPAPGTLKSLKIEDFQAIKKLDSIAVASPVNRRSYIIIYKNNNWNTTVSGVDASFPKIEKNNTCEGSFITEQQVLRRERVAVLGQTVKEQLFKNEDALGKYIRINNQPFRVVGILEKKGANNYGQDRDDNIFIPYTTEMERLESHSYLQSIFVLGKNKKDISQVESDINNLLRLRHHIAYNGEPDFNLHTLATFIKTVEKTTGTLTLFLGAIAAISLLVGGIGIMNIMLVSVTERTREIGIRKALGATYKTIITQFLIEAVVISLFGGLLGIIIGIIATELISLIFNMETLISMGTIILSFGFSMAIGLIFGIYPARTAAKLNPIEALHYE